MRLFSLSLRLPSDLLRKFWLFQDFSSMWKILRSTKEPLYALRKIFTLKRVHIVLVCFVGILKNTEKSKPKLLVQ